MPLNPPLPPLCSRRAISNTVLFPLNHQIPTASQGQPNMQDGIMIWCIMVNPVYLLCRKHTASPPWGHRHLFLHSFIYTTGVAMGRNHSCVQFLERAPTQQHEKSEKEPLKYHSSSSYTKSHVLSCSSCQTSLCHTLHENHKESGDWEAAPCPRENKPVDMQRLRSGWSL